VTELVTTGRCLTCAEVWSGTSSDKEAEKHTKTTKHPTVVSTKPKETS
jgi:hypothetical protein